jgi:hypothetical protein
MDKALLCGMLVEREPGESINEWLDRIEGMGRERHRFRRMRSKKRDAAKNDPHILRRPAQACAISTMAGMSTSQIAALSDQMRTRDTKKKRSALQPADQPEQPRPTATAPQARVQPALFEVVSKSIFTYWITYARTARPIGPLSVTWSPRLLASSILRCAIRLGIDPESVSLHAPAADHEQLYRSYLALVEEAMAMHVSDFPDVDIDNLIESVNGLNPGRLVTTQPSMVLSRFESVRQEQRRGLLLITENP